VCLNFIKSPLYNEYTLITTAIFIFSHFRENRVINNIEHFRRPGMEFSQQENFIFLTGYMLITLIFSLNLAYA
jgi:hypothetical protein